MPRNLPQLMDDYFRLYAPVYAQLLQEFPKVHGLSGCIGRDEPIAYPTDEEQRGYRLEKFETRAAKQLEKLVDLTMELQNSCEVTAGQHEPVSITAERRGAEIAIQVTVSDKLGGIFTRRVGRYIPNAIDAYFLMPAQIIVTAGDEKDTNIRETLRIATTNGFRHAVKTADELGVILNRSWLTKDDPSVDAWLAQFPRNDDDPATFSNLVAHFDRIVAKSSYKPIVIMAPSEKIHMVPNDVGECIIEPLELEIESLHYRP
jgi:hypothetical protein